MKKKKFQLNLDSFLGIKAKIKQYFYIDWTKASNNEIPIAEWLEKKPEGITWSQIIKWKNVGDIIVCCKDNNAFIEEDSQNFNIETQLKIINNVSWDEKKSVMVFLKSHLQKCLRRKRNVEALRSAYEMMLINVNEVLRRVCIIIFEDIKLKDYYPTMVWLMAAVGKGYKLQSYHINLELKFINDLCLEDNFTELSELNKYNNHYKKIDVRNLLLEIESDENLTNEQRSIIYSIGLRIGFGGKEDDMKMLFDYSLIWYNKFKNKEDEVPKMDINKSKFVCIEYCQNNRFQKIEDFVYQGVDVNSNYKMVPEIYEEINHHYSIKEIKTAMWWVSSGYNVRKGPQYDEKMEACWKEIKDILKRKQIFFLKYILSKIIS